MKTSRTAHRRVTTGGAEGGGPGGRGGRGGAGMPVREAGAGQRRRALRLLSAAAVAFAAGSAAAFCQGAPPPGGTPTDAEMLGLMKMHCVQCHAAEPTHEAFAKAPAGVLLETIDEVSRNAPRIMNQVVVTRAMPLGNQTGMTDEERNRIAAWIEGRK